MLPSTVLATWNAANAATWVLVFVLALTAIVTLFLIVYLFIRREERSDRVPDPLLRILRILAVGVLVEGATTVFAVILRDCRAQDCPESVTETVTVPVSCHLTLPLPLADDIAKGKGTSRGYLEIPARSKACFVSARSVRWTNDPLNAIQAFIGCVPFRWNIEEILQKWVEYQAEAGPQATPDAFQRFATEYANEIHQSLVQAQLAPPKGHMGASADRGRGEQIEQDTTSYVLKKLAPQIMEAAFRGQKDVLIDCTLEKPWSPDQYRTPKHSLWKRWFAYRFERPNSHLLGPYFSVEGAPGAELPQQAQSKWYPARNAKVGSLVALRLKEETDDREESRGRLSWLSFGHGEPFSTTAHAIENKSDRPVWVRLVINDEIPEDNGTGFAEVVAELKPIE